MIMKNEILVGRVRHKVWWKVSCHESGLRNNLKQSYDIWIILTLPVLLFVVNDMKISQNIYICGN